MATSSIGQAIVLNNDMADRLIAQIEKTEAKPPKPRSTKIRWVDPDKYAESLKQKYADAR